MLTPGNPAAGPASRSDLLAPLPHMNRDTVVPWFGASRPCRRPLAGATRGRSRWRETFSRRNADRREAMTVRSPALLLRRLLLLAFSASLVPRAARPAGNAPSPPVRRAPRRSPGGPWRCGPRSPSARLRRRWSAAAGREDRSPLRRPGRSHAAAGADAAAASLQGRARQQLPCRLQQTLRAGQPAGPLLRQPATAAIAA